MSQLNLIIGPAQLQEYDGEKEKEEERQRKKRLLKALEDKFKVEQHYRLRNMLSVCPTNSGILWGSFNDLKAMTKRGLVSDWLL